MSGYAQTEIAIHMSIVDGGPTCRRPPRWRQAARALGVRPSAIRLTGRTRADAVVSFVVGRQQEPTTCRTSVAAAMLLLARHGWRG